MSQPPDNWFELEDFAVYGLGRSGRAAANLLAQRGKRVIASDTRSKSELRPELDTLDERVRRIFGRNDHAGADAVVLSPGIQPTSRVVEQLRGEDCWILSEIDLAFDAADAEFVAITGTDGKTTTTSICGSIFSASGRNASVAGNIGRPLCRAVMDKPDWIVAEVSAFQLWSSRHFEPHVAGLTNIGADHLDYFESWEDYLDAKRRLADLTADEGTVVLNADDERLARWANQVPPRELTAYSTNGPPDGADSALWSDERAFFYAPQAGGEEEAFFEREDWSLPGEHNVANALCASGVAFGAGIDAGSIAGGLESFEALPHRVEQITNYKGIDVYNDSKATNVQSAVAGLNCIEAPYVAIVGGVDKGLEMDSLFDELHERAAAVVVIGELADRFRREFQASARRSDAGTDAIPVRDADTLEDALERAITLARERGAHAVSLSPAASSFDMFDSYEHRGETFRDAVQALDR